ncbi:hypothetical protein [Shewanella sp. 10N.286.48.A6]|uniref:hypothetical protein n=1 Tax=Shewanella sp. 10N.286.48.A6 TaxID=1880833 RepID=UPI0039A6D1BC
MQSPLFLHPLQITPKVCPECIIDAAYYRDEWQNPYISYCEVHNVPLLSKCSKCLSLLKFEPELLQAKCTNPICNSPLKAQSDERFNLTQEQVCDVLLAAHMIKNTNPLQLEKYPNLPDYELTMNLGYEFLTKNQHATDWANKVIHSISGYYPTNIAINVITTFLSHLKSDWPSIKALEHLIQHQTIRCLSPISTVWLTAHDACKRLAVTVGDLAAFNSVNLIDSKSNVRISSKSIVDVSPLFKLLSSQQMLPNMIPLSSYETELLRNDVGLKDIIIAINHGSLITGYLSGSSLFNSLYCDEQSLVNFIKQHFSKVKERIIDIDKAMQLTGASRDEIMMYRKLGKAPIPRWSGHNGCEQVAYEDVLKIRIIKEQIAFEM